MWGTICDDNFGNVDAGVACTMLGLGYVSTCDHLFLGLVSISISLSNWTVKQINYHLSPVTHGRLVAGVWR